MIHLTGKFGRIPAAVIGMVLLTAGAIFSTAGAESEVQQLPLQFVHDEITYSSKVCDDYNKSEPCSGYMTLGFSDGQLVVSIHRTANGSITAPIVIDTPVSSRVDRDAKTLRWADYSDPYTAPYVERRMFQEPAFIAIRHDRAVFQSVVDQYLAALAELGFTTTVEPGVNSNIVWLYPTGDTAGTSITLYRSDGGVTARFASAR